MLLYTSIRADRAPVARWVHVARHPTHALAFRTRNYSLMGVGSTPERAELAPSCRGGDIRYISSGSRMNKIEDVYPGMYRDPFFWSSSSCSHDA